MMKYLQEWESYYDCTLARAVKKVCVIEAEKNVPETMKQCLTTHFGMFFNAEMSKCIHEFSFNRNDLQRKSVFKNYYGLLQKADKDKIEAVHASTLNKFKSNS